MRKKHVERRTLHITTELTLLIGNCIPSGLTHFYADYHKDKLNIAQFDHLILQKYSTDAHQSHQLTKYNESSRKAR